MPRASPQRKKKIIPSPICLERLLRRDFLFATSAVWKWKEVKIEHSTADARPAFVLADVQGADFARIKAPSAAGVPTFVLNDVRDFSCLRK